MPFLNAYKANIKFLSMNTGGVKASVSASEVTSKVLKKELDQHFPGKYSVQVRRFTDAKKWLWLSLTLKIAA